MGKSGKRVFCYAAAALLCIVGAVFFLRVPVLSGIGRFLIIADPLQKADAIAILSGDGSVRGPRAAELYHQKWAPRILITKEGFPYREGEWARYGVIFPETDAATVAVLKYLAVPAGDIEVLDGYNDSTVEEARRYLRFVQSRGWHRLIVVTSGFHTRRSRLIFNRIFRNSKIQIFVQPAPQEADFDPYHWWERRLDSKKLLEEYQKLAFYSVRYW